MAPPTHPALTSAPAGRRHDEAAKDLESTARRQEQSASVLAGDKEQLRAALRRAEEELERTKALVQPTWVLGLDFD
jgi:hypothetical protein